MKKSLFILVLISSLLVNAQKKECEPWINEYQNLMKETKMTEAYATWLLVKKDCPKSSEELYWDGFKILQYKADNEVGESKDATIEELLTLYDLFFKNFPEAIQEVELKKAQVLLNNANSDKRLEGLLEKAFEKYPEKIQDPQALFYYLKYSNASKRITNTQQVGRYILVSGLLKQLMQTNAAQLADYVAVQKAIDAQATEWLTCENLNQYFTSELPKNEQNSTWLIASLQVLSKKCSNLPLFKDMAEKLYKLKESNISAQFMAVASMKNRAFEDAGTYYEKAAALEENPIEKAQIYYTIATSLMNGKPEKAQTYLQQAIQLNPKNGKYYLYLAQLYVNHSQQCAQNNFDEKLVYYLAIKTAQKAQEVEPVLKATVNRFELENGKKALTDKEIKEKRLKGKSVKVNCWINQTVVFP